MKSCSVDSEATYNTKALTRRAVSEPRLDVELCTLELLHSLGNEIVLDLNLLEGRDRCSTDKSVRGLTPRLPCTQHILNTSPRPSDSRLLVSEDVSVWGSVL